MLARGVAPHEGSSRAQSRCARVIAARPPGDARQLPRPGSACSLQENRPGDAIRRSRELVAVEPKRARELYQRMAQYALQLYRDDDAVEVRARAVELNPDDARGPSPPR